MGKISIKRLIGAIGGAMTVVSIMLVAMLASGSLFGTIGPGIGGFKTKFSSVNGSNVTMYTSMSKGGSGSGGKVCENGEGGIPVLTAKMKHAAVKGMDIEKSVKLPEGLPAKEVSVDIKQGKDTETDIGQVSMQLTSLSTKSIDIDSNVTLGGGQSGRMGGFGINGTGTLVLNGGVSDAEVVSFSGVSLNKGVNVKLHASDGSEKGGKDSGKGGRADLERNGSLTERFCQ